MKRKEIMTTMLVALLLVFLSGNAIAQTKEDTHKKLTANHQTIMKHAHAIASGEAVTKDEQIRDANEATKSLGEAKETHKELKNLIPAKHNMAAKPHQDNIDKHYAAATTHANSLNAELKKDPSDNAKVKEHAKNLHDEVEKAEKEHQELIEITK